MGRKLTIASDWMTGCAGCHMSLLDMDERLLALLQHADITSSPITDLKHPPKEGVDIGILEGGINNSTAERVAKEMRERSRILIALGDCAVFGGVPTLRNGASIQCALRRAYVEAESVVDGKIPDDPELARMQKCRAVNQVVKVDVHLPGCPPSADVIFHALFELAQGRTPTLDGRFLDWH